MGSVNKGDGKQRSTNNANNLFGRNVAGGLELRANEAGGNGEDGNAGDNGCWLLGGGRLVRSG